MPCSAMRKRLETIAGAVQQTVYYSTLRCFGARAAAFGPAVVLLCSLLALVAASGYAAGAHAARCTALGLLTTLLLVVWCEWDWFVHVWLAFDKDRAIKLEEYQARNATTWKNKVSFLGTRSSVPGSNGSENFTTTLT